MTTAETAASRPGPQRGCLFRLLTGLACMFFATLAGRAATPEEEFTRANQLCEQGQYTAAVTQYEKLIQSGHGSAAVFFNLGNACFHAGQTGKAVWAWRHAERLAPRDPDIRANLSVVRRAVSGKDEAGPRGFEMFFTRLTLNEWGLLAAAGLWAWLILLAAGQWQEKWRGALRPYVWGAGLMFAGGAGGLGGAVYWQCFHPIAIVAQPEAQVRLAPYEVSKPVWALPAGAEVTVVRRDKEWIEVRGSDGRAGWLRCQDVFLWPPETTAAAPNPIMGAARRSDKKSLPK